MHVRISCIAYLGPFHFELYFCYASFKIHLQLSVAFWNNWLKLSLHKVSNKILQRNAVNVCGNWMCKCAFNATINILFYRISLPFKIFEKLCTNHIILKILDINGLNMSIILATEIWKLLQCYNIVYCKISQLLSIYFIKLISGSNGLIFFLKTKREKKLIGILQKRWRKIVGKFWTEIRSLNLNCLTTFRSLK